MAVSAPTDRRFRRAHVKPAQKRSWRDVSWRTAAFMGQLELVRTAMRGTDIEAQDANARAAAPLLAVLPPAAQAIDSEVRRIIGECHDQARTLLSRHRAQLDALARALLERETLDEQEILEVTGLPPAPALDVTLTMDN